MFQGLVGLAGLVLAKLSLTAAEPEVKISAAASPNTRPAEMTTPVTMAGVGAADDVPDAEKGAESASESE